MGAMNNPACNYRHLLSEIEGFLEIGLREQSIEKASEILSHPELESHGFDLAAFAVIDWNLPDLLKRMESELAAAFRRLPNAAQAKAQHYMCALYKCLEDYSSALPFATTSPLNVVHLRESMIVFLEVPGHQKEADALLSLADEMLSGNLDPYDRAIVLYAKVCHAMKAKDWARAKACLDTLNPFREPWNGTIRHPHWDSQYRDRLRIRFQETLSELEAILVELGHLGRARETETELSHAGLNESCLHLLRHDFERMARVVRILERHAPNVIPPLERWRSP